MDVTATCPPGQGANSGQMRSDLRKESSVVSAELFLWERCVCSRNRKFFGTERTRGCVRGKEVLAVRRDPQLI